MHIEAAALLILPALTVPVAADELTYVLDPDGERPPQRVVADNACAWPNLTVLPNGDIVAVIFNSPYHANTIGDVECWGTGDNGETWSLRGVPAVHDPEHSNRMNVAAGLAHNGDLIVISSGWELKMNPQPPEGEVWTGGLVRVLEPWVCRSADGGRTWQVDRDAMPDVALTGGLSPDATPPIPFGDIFRCPDGSLRVAAYARIANEPERLRRAWVYRSDDDGLTWGQPIPINPEGNHSEVALLPLGEGRWLAAARSPGLQLYLSEDDCATWQHRMRLPVGGYPAHLVRLGSGRIVLSVGTRSGEERATRVFYSDDEGESWSRPYVVAAYFSDGGYPSTVELPDARALTAYYARSTVDHPRYHLGVVIWDPATTFAQ